MISKNQLKLLRALAQKKYRKQHGLYLVQGQKNVQELLTANVAIEQLFASAQFIAEHQAQLQSIQYIETDNESLTKASTLTSNSAAIAIVKFPEPQAINESGMILALDGVSDPGNLGTIIRVADWYGFKQIVLSDDCADHLNPKVISATMGSFVRINVVRTNLAVFLSRYDGAIYGAFLDGQSVHTTAFAKRGVLVMGSESHGIREQASQYINTPITIPAFGGAESLNVAMATGIILDNIKRSS
ncbi:23S rRNA (guanosine-2'-O-)-methyltransferase RlmB [Pseudoalteromonas holothuriae]|uniref:23S rRNA (Guanosine-2'-O-)-methyltransferase RlmB n=1 Tax=Pseudoalteromonas holothuriae TaxID=2963714 RepID=A0ABN8ULC4_9GAMM|nr:RNA methyltransferase [Pseudoalteromonas sp. CIP111951]CAH9052007.1 23S rRNA (guanosine-2'-O-)-methyltransferase RlmB [Pseudoalteromonas sp. CIP111951]